MSNSNLADKWFDAIDDIDDFLEQLVTINEQSLETSPSLKDFCQTIYVSMQNASDLDYHDSNICLLYTSPSPRDRQKSRMPSSA